MLYTDEDGRREETQTNKHESRKGHDTVGRNDIDTKRGAKLKWPVNGGSKGQSNSGSFRCVWSCDNNKYANQVYTKQFGEEGHYTADIRGVNSEDIPDFDLLCAGFPCQAFSVAGKRKGFQDTRGTLFFEIHRIAEAKRPSLLLLENVKGLLNHDGGRTFTVILQSLDELGYWVEWQVLNSKYFGVPQNRERVFIVGHLRGGGGREVFPIEEADKYIAGTQEKTRGERTRLRDEHNSISRSLRVGGSGIEDNLIAQTISARYYKDGSENLLGVYDPYNQSIRRDRLAGAIKTNQGSPTSTGTAIGVTLANTGRYNQGVNRTPVQSEELSWALNSAGDQGVLQEMRIRRLTPVECERLQGFPDGWTDGLSDTQRYKCLGNAVTVNVIEYLGHRIREALNES